MLACFLSELRNALTPLTLIHHPKQTFVVESPKFNIVQ